jgi:hypothetical protein
MADITLRDTPTEAVSTGATVKDAPLSILEVDDNFNNLNAEVAGKVEPADYATDTVGGTVKARIDGTSLYLTTNGSNA